MLRKAQLELVLSDEELHARLSRPERAAGTRWRSAEEKTRPGRRTSIHVRSNAYIYEAIGVVRMHARTHVCAQYEHESVCVYVYVEERGAIKDENVTCAQP